MPPKYNIKGAMFDVKPVTASGGVDVAKIEQLLSRINLRKTVQPAQRHAPVSRQTSLSKAALATDRKLVLRELQSSLNTSGDHRAVLARIGARLEPPHYNKPRIRPIVPPREDIQVRHHEHIITEMHQSRPLQEPEVVPQQMPEVVPSLAVAPTHIPSEHVERWWAEHQARAIAVPHSDGRRPWYRRKFIAALAILAVLGVSIPYAFGLKNRVMEQGNQAVQSLEDAKTNLGNLDFAAASENFISAYEEFSRAGNTLNVLGENIGSLLANVPGAESLKSAQSLLEIGKLIANTGQAMADTMTALSQAGVLFTPQNKTNIPAGQVLTSLNDALSVADTNLKKVRVLLADVDMSVLPEDTQVAFGAFTEQFPQLQELVSQGSEFAQFLETMVSVRGTKRYLILFQNHSELRPTGGFPGSYALLTFEKGRMKEYKVGDVYDIDGQIKGLIIPPLQLQHITPTWAMRDANWFIDFPSSAKKITAFFKKETGLSLDGVLTVSPAVFQDILRIVGPIEMPAYGKTITADNFLATIQAEVEYGPNKEVNAPKKIIMDMAPLVMQKLASADHASWLSIFNSFIAGLERKDVLMYFKDLNLQSFALEKGFSGEVKTTDGDYLMVTATNVKGSKTDIVTATVMKLGTYFEQGTVRHKLVLGRTNNGGKSQYGFYNKQNPAFIRVLVPKGSTLVSINGQSIPAYRPLVTYDDHFQKDADLERFENTFRSASAGVWTYEEAGKTGFAFWMIVDPGSSRTVELEYVVPPSVTSSDYALYVQKQPGLKIQNFNFELHLPDTLTISNSKPTLRQIGDIATFSGTFERDLMVQVELQ